MEVPPESGRSSEIINYLFAQLLPLVGFRQLRVRGLEVEVRGEPRNRFPDLAVIQPAHGELLRQRDTIRLFMPPPLVVEVVSPGNVQRDRDYIAKRSQYDNRGIPEYWIVDPVQNQLMVLNLIEDHYQSRIFRGSELIQSRVLAGLDLRVNQLLQTTADGLA